MIAVAREDSPAPSYCPVPDCPGYLPRGDGATVGMVAGRRFGHGEPIHASCYQRLWHRERQAGRGVASAPHRIEGPRPVRARMPTRSPRPAPAPASPPPRARPSPRRPKAVIPHDPGPATCAASPPPTTAAFAAYPPPRSKPPGLQAPAPLRTQAGTFDAMSPAAVCREIRKLWGTPSAALVLTVERPGQSWEGDRDGNR